MVLEGEAAEMTGKQEDGGIPIDRVPCSLAIRDCGVESGERIRDRGDGAGVESLVVTGGGIEHQVSPSNGNTPFLPPDLPSAFWPSVGTLDSCA